jgi:hypothetical protein
MTTTETPTAADTFANMAAEIVKRTGCTVETAVEHLLRKVYEERPALFLKVVAGSGILAG